MILPDTEDQCIEFKSVCGCGGMVGGCFVCLALVFMSFFLKWFCKDNLLVPIPLCTQKGSYQAQNNYPGPVTMLTFNFEIEGIHARLRAIQEHLLFS